MITKLEENLVLDNGYVKIYNDRVSFNGVSEGFYFKYSLSNIKANYGVAIICEYKELIYLQEIFRYAPQKYLIEVVKGMGMEGKSPLETAIIEVKEEMGGKIKEIEDLGSVIYDSSDFDVYCFHAKIESFGEKDLEVSEFIKNRKGYSIKELKEMIKENKIQDSITLAILTKYIFLKII